jgi:transposase-like protein
MMSDTKTAQTMTCEACKVNCQRFGKHRNGLSRFRCPNCKKTYTEAHSRVLDSMYISEEKAVLAIRLLGGIDIYTLQQKFGLLKLWYGEPV